MLGQEPQYCMYFLLKIVCDRLVTYLTKFIRNAARGWPVLQSIVFAHERAREDWGERHV